MILLTFAAVASAGVPISPALLARYDAIRLELVADRVAEAEAAARELATFAASDPALAVPAAQLGAATDAHAARVAFGALSRALVVEISTSGGPKVFAYRCPMWSDGFAWWVQPTPGIANPYMGASMPECGEERSLKAAVKAAGS